MDKVKVAIVGLGFGAEFIPIYQKHPQAECVAICQRNPEKLANVVQKFEIPKHYTNYAEMLKDPEIDAVHINSPIADHAPMTIQALKAGKHAACTVPMACTKEECIEIAHLRDAKKLVYMMMETAVFTREFFYVRDLVRKKEIGKIQFLRGSHQQNMSLPGWPEYWYGFPPMHYATHAVSPLLCLAQAECESVVCLGSGRIRDEYVKPYNSPFAVETALLKLRNSDLACEVTRSLFDTIRQYRESFDIFGTKMSFEWEQCFRDGMVVFSGFEDFKRTHVPDYGHLLPKEIAPFTGGGVYDDKDNVHTSFVQGAGHGGSHPHLAHEFVSAILEGRDSLVDAVRAANWTMAGICAHESAMAGGKRIEVPAIALKTGNGANWF